MSENCATLKSMRERLNGMRDEEPPISVGTEEPRQ